MKKIILGIVILLTAIILPRSVNATEKVTIYLFRGETCEHCEKALDYISKNRDKIGENIEFITYEVWKNSDNASLLMSVAEEIGVPEKSQGSVPLFVIGEEYVLGYGSSATFDKVLEYANNYLEDEDYKDIVKEKIDAGEFKVKGYTLEDLFGDASNSGNVIVYIVFGIIVLGFVALIIFSRKK